MPELIRCSCTRINDPWRRFCGGCGLALAPACGSCSFVNNKHDRFCGGCGTSLGKAGHLAAGTVRGNPVRVSPSKPLVSAGKQEQTIPLDVIEEV